MNLITRTRTFADRFRYRCLEDEIHEIMGDRQRLRDERLLVSDAYASLGRTLADRLKTLHIVAQRLHAAGVERRDYAMGNFEIGYTLLATAGLLGIGLIQLFARA